MKRYKLYVGALALLIGAALLIFLGVKSLFKVGSNAMTVPTDIAIPSSDRITTDSSGQLVVRDEIIVGLAFDTPNPQERIVDIALSTHGVIVGSIPEALTYQLQYVVADLDALEAIRVSLEGMPDVEFASRHFLAPVATEDSGHVP